MSCDISYGVLLVVCQQDSFALLRSLPAIIFLTVMLLLLLLLQFLLPTLSLLFNFIVSFCSSPSGFLRRAWHSAF